MSDYKSNKSKSYVEAYSMNLIIQKIVITGNHSMQNALYTSRELSMIVHTNKHIHMLKHISCSFELRSVSLQQQQKQQLSVNHMNPHALLN